MYFSKNVQPFLENGRKNSPTNMEDPTTIKFSIGNPPPEGFPVERIRAISDRLLREDPYSLMNYSTGGGRADFRAAIKSFLNRRFETVKEGDTITVVNGGQQGIAFAAQLFCDRGDIVLCEDPTFMVAIEIFRSFGAVPVGVKMTDDGIDLEDLEAKMQMEPKPRMLYIIPDFQNPMGVCLSEHKRREICRLAYKYDIPVIEDNPYYELRYDGDFIPYIKCFDEHGMVALVSSMSKIVAPGMRTGYVVAPGKMGEGFAHLKFSMDFHVPTWTQRVCCTLLEEGIDEDIAALRELYGHRGRRMLSLLEKYCHPSVTFTRPQGGMFIWVSMPEGTDIKGFLRELAEKKVTVVPGGRFFVDSPDVTAFRLSYSLASDDELDRGIAIIGELTYKYCK